MRAEQRAANRVFQDQAHVAAADVYLGLKVLHGFLKGLGWRSLVVTEDGHGAVGSVVRQDFSRNAVVSCKSDNDTSKYEAYLDA